MNVEVGVEASIDFSVLVGSVHSKLELVVPEGEERRNHQFKVVSVFITRAVLSLLLRAEIFRKKGN